MLVTIHDSRAPPKCLYFLDYTLLYCPFACGSAIYLQQVSRPCMYWFLVLRLVLIHWVCNANGIVVNSLVLLNTLNCIVGVT